MIQIKRFIEKVSLLESKQTKDLIIPMSDARFLRDEIVGILADLQEFNSNNKKDEKIVQIQIKGGTFK